MKVHLYLPTLRNPVTIEIPIPADVEPERYIQSVMSGARWNWPGCQMKASIGKKVGRPRLTAEHIPSKFKRSYMHFLQGKLNISQLAKLCDLTRPTVYKYIRLIQEQEKRNEQT